MKLAVILAALAIVGVLAFQALDPIQAERRANQAQYEAERNRLDIERRSLDNTQYAATQPGRIVSDYGFMALLLAGCAAVGVVLIDAYRQRRRPVVRFGGYPVARELVSGGDRVLVDLMAQAIMASKAAEIEAARRPIPPMHYSPHLTIRQDSAAVALPALGGASSPIVVPSFANLLDTAAIGVSAEGRRQPIILGYGGDGAITGDWRSLYSSGLGGLQGSGKTWGASFLLAQSALNGAKIVICDPHAGDEESLAARVGSLAPAFLCDIADDERSILAALKLADDRLQARKNGDADRIPIIVAIDEWSSLRRGRVAELLPGLVEDFSTEGRKLNCHVMLLGQRWDKESVGDFRNTLASSYVFRMRADEARMMTGLRAAALPADTLQLAPGSAYLLDTHGQIVKVQIPQMAPSDMARVGELLGQPSNVATTAPSDRPFGFRPATRPVGAVEGAMEGARHVAPSSASERTEAGDPEAVRVLALIRAGKSISEVIREIWGVAAGRLYQEKATYVMDVIRQALAS